MPKRAVILVAEGDKDFAVLMQEGFSRANIQNLRHFVSNGRDLISYLEGEGRYADRAEFPLPDILFLDLKLPEISGFEVLRWLRSRPELSEIRVIVLSASGALNDIQQAYGLGANSFLLKVHNFQHDLENLAAAYKEWGFSYESVRKTISPPTISPPAFSIVWDPELLSPEDYADLVEAIGDVVRAEGGLGIKLLRSNRYGAPVCEGIVK